MDKNELTKLASAAQINPCAVLDTLIAKTEIAQKYLVDLTMQTQTLVEILNFIKSELKCPKNES